MPATRPQGELVEDLMRRLGEVSKPPRHVFHAVKFFVAEWSRLTTSYRYVRHSPERVSQALHEAADEADRIAEAEGRTAMFVELMAAFVDASERSKREEAWGDVYEAAAEEDDGGFADASALEAGTRWPAAH
jgi:hypothetical protein